MVRVTEAAAEICIFLCLFPSWFCFNAVKLWKPTRFESVSISWFVLTFYDKIQIITEDDWTAKRLIGPTRRLRVWRRQSLRKQVVKQSNLLCIFIWARRHKSDWHQVVISCYRNASSQRLMLILRNNAAPCTPAILHCCIRLYQ